MTFGVMFFVVAVAVIAIWIIIETKRLKHKIFAIVIIGLILFTYISFTVVLRNTDTDVKTVNGLMTAGKLYGIWLGNIFHNIKSVTSYASKQDWKNLNKTDSSSISNENKTQQEPTNLTENNQINNNSTNQSKLNSTDPLQAIWDKL